MKEGRHEEGLVKEDRTGKGAAEDESEEKKRNRKRKNPTEDKENGRQGKG